VRIVHWLFVVSVLLFISGIGFVVAGARAARQAPAASEAPALTPVADVKQIMNAIVQPAAAVVFGAVGTEVSAAGTVDIRPQNDEEWAAVGASAAALAESANLLIMDGRAVDRGDWVTMSRALATAATTALKAVEAKDPNALLTYGSDINDTCDKCHERYQRQ
jgi:hypothetical protein